ncbi:MULTISPECIES: putative baseplate assembly protein [unclassified Coleofasciculus]|uniref:putative baseplate assembly protein n=1 Tax=unclassified Coleofasciculus TaxID=2692782 RepID=UPI00188308FA|nr:MULTISPECIES: putative baseplate assembly protein [unclassified Coleofasciculus]MBE9126974.1 putative baseplate assembly protein [Coleofasciculus sp. LEGE 07081]MBE9150343.1 putative baseplate assembly protein [Coleofasciculus sp. LEGE 07092]
MEFDFLPKLPKSNLDDRTFQELVEECILRIPRYCPEWTNYNPSDPGITLIELFAWLTDQMLLRFNQVPRRNYVTFLELLGIRLQAPTPAQTQQTFYLSATLPEAYTIPAGTEVATIRTESEDAIIFSTDRPLVIAQPSIRHFLTAETADEQPQVLRDRFVGTWTQQPTGEWEGLEIPCFNEQPEPGNCFYVVFDLEQPVEGNVIAISLKGEAATSTGINPEIPPRRWEAWNGLSWEPILLQETDDGTKGFSFSELVRQGGDPLQGADIVLHLPLRWPVTQFLTYQGRWLRCTYIHTQLNQPGYIRSPRFVGLDARSIGGTVEVTQCTTIRNEILGQSDGTPGQTFELQGTGILPRREDEHLLITPPGGLPQIWQEVNDFADSGPEDLHYTIDAITGTVQFGPLLREPTQLSEQTRWRSYSQGLSTEMVSLSNGRSGMLERLDAAAVQSKERQYGAVPPRGATLQMVSYRIGGGRQGNVQSGTLRILKSAVPYVANVINHIPARNGADAESLEEAAIRVPQLLRTRDRAVTPEDFEYLTLQAAGGGIARVLCLPPIRKEQAGRVRLLLVPQTNTDGIEQGEGIDPDGLALTPQLTDRVLTYLDERRLLGVEVLCNQPEYVGVAVQTEVALDPAYNNPRAQQDILVKLQSALYRFLNPLTGGPDRNGWPFGRPVYSSDIVTLLQSVVGVRYLGTVQLFELRYQGQTWTRNLPREPVIDPGPLGLICSWHNSRLRSGHVINLL